MKFLIIDDNPSDRELVVRRLRREYADAEFVEFGHRKDLNEAIAQDDYDIVLTDYQLNFTDGLWILSAVKKNNPYIPVVMFTGTGNEEVAVEGMRAGLSNYILKKHLDHLPFAVRESLEKAKLQKQYDEAIGELRASEERYREVFEQGLTGIFIFSPQGKLLACNTAFANMFKFPAVEDALRSNVRDLYPDKGAFDAFVALVQREKRLAYYEAEMCRHNGEALYVIANVIGSFDAGGNLVEIKAYFFDNTEHKRLEEQYQHAQKMESLGQLVSGIAHDFNNMLGGILGHAERSMAKISVNHPIYESLRHIKDITQRAGKMTGQLLAFSRRQVLEPKDINVNNVVTELLDFIGRILAEQVEIVFKPDLELKAIHADPSQIEQVLMNLCLNARDAMPDGGTLRIETRNVSLDRAFCRQHPGVQPGEYICVAITDTGRGMEERVRKRIFEPFFTTKELGKGTGLGLSMVHGVVGQHNGYIDVSSKVGKGTTFKVYLPAVDREPIPMRSENKASQLAEPVLARSETILLVEDDTDLRFLMTEVLQDYGYSVISAGNGEEGLQLYKQHAPSIAMVVADVVTPKMKGNELYKKVHDMDPAAKFLFVSGYQANQISRNFILDKGLHFLPKPFDLDELATKVREVLE